MKEEKEPDPGSRKALDMAVIKRKSGLTAKKERISK